jgi:hypothetical protein
MATLAIQIERAVSAQWDIAPRILLHLNPQDAATLCGRIQLPAHVHVVPDPFQDTGTFLLRPASRIYT